MPARQHRITRGDDYRRIVRKGNRVGGAYCITHAVFHVQGGMPEHGVDPDEQSVRFGFIVAKTVGNAVTRNLVRRRLKHLARNLISEGFSGADVVFRALPASAAASFSELEAEVRRAIGRLERDRGRRSARSGG